MSKMDSDDRSGNYEIVGRPDVDLTQYLVIVNGRSIIDYDRIKVENPSLYQELLQLEDEINEQEDLYLESLK
ncbi:hypothetical protein KC930_04275 [Candidatus Saccharibacteria bacterium]|nr:hypothetical protein [Candidatus Saccharibacteria bacterium]